MLFSNYFCGFFHPHAQFPIIDRKISVNCTILLNSQILDHLIFSFTKSVIYCTLNIVISMFSITKINTHKNKTVTAS